MIRMNTALLAARRGRRGATMLEILFALSIIAFLGLGALYLYNQATTGNRNRTAISQIQNVQQSVRTLYAGQSDYGATGADITVILAGSKTLPGNMVSGTTLRHVFGGTVTVAAQAAGATWGGLTTAGPSFVTTFTNVPAEACATLATADNGGPSSGLVGVMVGSGSAVAPPLTPGGVTGTGGICAGLTGTITMAFRYQ